jgi:hypothetical protein
MTKNEHIRFQAYGLRILALAHARTAQELRKQVQGIDVHKKVLFYSYPHSTTEHVTQNLLCVAFLESSQVWPEPQKCL